MFQRIHIYTDVTLCWQIGGSCHFIGQHCLHLQEWKTPRNIKMSRTAHPETQNHTVEDLNPNAKLLNRITSQQTHTGRSKTKDILKTSQGFQMSLLLRALNVFS